ncbi:hypothetical protein [Bradyrhizobium sp. C-145]|nr:hypothetical protein [Bradyrhizobium sp. C-145]
MLRHGGVLVIAAYALMRGNPLARAVILTTPEEHDVWLRAPS